MFQDESHRIEYNPPRLSYGVAATDIDGDGRPELVVTGFGTSNVVLDWQDDGRIRDIAPPTLADPHRRGIGVAAADVNRDGQEEVYVLNTDTFMGMKRFGDRLFLQRESGNEDSWIDLFELPANVENPNLNAGRSVAAVDVDGSGAYRFLVANYGGPVRLHQVDDRNRVRDTAAELGIHIITGGRSLCVLPDVGTYSAIFCGNENDANALFVRTADGTYLNRADEYDVSDAMEHARGVAPVDTDNDGLLELIVANWEGPARLYVRRTPKDPRSPWSDRASARFREPQRNRNLIAADFDNDGRVELFFNNIGEANRLFRLREDGVEELNLGAAAEPDGLGTGAAVADLNGDGVLELLIAHGEEEQQPLSLFSSPAASRGNYLRVAPLTDFGAPARGAIVHLYAGDHRQVRAVDGGSGYLCQMEPVAHFGLGGRREVDAVDIIWPGGRRRRINQPQINQEIEATP
ncbi:MAG: CRTAC1 family protein [Alkalispirochaeta sp.]